MLSKIKKTKKKLTKN